MKETVEQAAKEYADKNYPKMGLYGDWEDDGFDEGWNAAKNSSGKADFIAGAQWQSKQSPWISVKERLPEHDNGQSLCNVIIKFDDGSHYIVANIDVEDMAKAGGATHWMPIPE